MGGKVIFNLSCVAVNFISDYPYKTNRGEHENVCEIDFTTHAWLEAWNVAVAEGVGSDDHVLRPRQPPHDPRHLGVVDFTHQVPVAKVQARGLVRRQHTPCIDTHPTAQGQPPAQQMDGECPESGVVSH